jgi:hypothetical protein
MLASVIKFNLCRALESNSACLGFGSGWQLENEISPFFRYKAPLSPELQAYPTYLRPTLLQNTVEHHPWIDLLPLPEMRDNILRLGDTYDDAPLCHDIVLDLEGGCTGLIVWGNPWDPRSWEVTEDFARKWPWVLQHCFELFRATNMWRAKRGEPKLFSDILCSR